MTFYIDETGNSGDVVVRSGKEMFGGQPVFALAAVGDSPGASDLGDAIRKLADEHGVAGAETEVKGGKIAKSRPAFVLALVCHLVEHGHPVLVELVDKGYHLATQIAQHFLLGAPTLAKGLDPHSVETWALSNRLAEVVYDHADRDLYELYSAAALSRSRADLHRFAVAYALWVNARFTAAQANDAPDVELLAEAMKWGFLTSTAFDTYRKKPDLSDEQVVEDFLPIPDTDNRGNRLAMHPHATSFLNLLARMNKVATELGRPDLTLVHDEQLQLAPVVTEHYEALTSGKFSFLDGRLSGSGLPFEENVRYEFSDDHDLRFADRQVLELASHPRAGGRHDRDRQPEPRGDEHQTRRHHRPTDGESPRPVRSRVQRARRFGHQNWK